MLMEHYAAAKEKDPDAVVLVPCAGFYDTFGPDAERVARLAGLRLTRHRSGAAQLIVPARDLNRVGGLVAGDGGRVVVAAETLVPADPLAPEPAPPTLFGDPD